MESFLQFFYEAKTSLTDNNVKKIIDDYISGVSFSELARKYKVSDDTIKRCLIKNGVGLRPTRVKHQKQSDKIVQMYNSGVSVAELARKFKVKHDTMKKYLIDNGIKLKPVGVKDQKQIDKIVQMHNSGIPIEKLGKEFNVSGNTIRNILKKNNSKFRNYRINNFETVDKIKEMYGNGMTFKEIAKNLNIDIQVLRRFLKKHSVKLERLSIKKQLPEIPKKRKTSKPNEEKRIAYYKRFYPDIETWSPSKLAWLKIIPKKAREKYGKFVKSEIGKDALNQIKKYFLNVKKPIQENLVNFLLKLTNNYVDKRKRPLSIEEIEALIIKLVYEPDWRHSKPVLKREFKIVPGKIENRNDEFKVITPFIKNMNKPFLTVMSLPEGFAFEQRLVNNFKKDVFDVCYEIDTKQVKNVEKNAEDVNKQLQKTGHKIVPIIINRDVNKDIENPETAIVGLKKYKKVLSDYKFDLIDLDYLGYPGGGMSGKFNTPAKAAKLLNPGGLLFVTYSAFEFRFNWAEKMINKLGLDYLKSNIVPGEIPNEFYFDPKNINGNKYFTNVSWAKKRWKKEPNVQAKVYSDTANIVNKYTKALLENIKQEGVDLQPIYVNVYPGKPTTYMYRAVFVKK
jgi:DNA invertase Pin-like site-specific DNA recombinase